MISPPWSELARLARLTSFTLVLFISGYLLKAKRFAHEPFAPDNMLHFSDSASSQVIKWCLEHEDLGTPGIAHTAGEMFCSATEEMRSCVIKVATGVSGAPRFSGLNKLSW